MTKGTVQKKPSAESDAPKLSAVEGIKENSAQLRGAIAHELQQDSDRFSEADKQLLKFHGSYQQEDRDVRKQRRKQGLGKCYIFMVRCKIPGGKLTADQYLSIDAVAGKYANATMRITSRQGIQLHGVLKTNLKKTIKGINNCLVSTLGACGDVNRNVMVCPLPYHDALRRELGVAGDRLAARFAPRSDAYHEIWLNGKAVSVASTPEVAEPIYGKTYLPRKFKLGLALPENNLIDIYAQDLGLLAVVQDGRIKGYNVLVGGGMGMTHGKPETFPHLSRPICYVSAWEADYVAECVIKLFRDHGNRENRKRARIKYLVHDWGVKKFREVLTEYVGHPLDDPKPLKATGFDLGLGWRKQGDGNFWYGVSVPSGRIKDEGKFQLRTALRKIIEKFQPEVRLTPMQDILLCHLQAAAKPEIEKILRKNGVAPPNEMPVLQQLSMACPAIPTCGLAISESERALPALLDELNAELRRLDLHKQEIGVRMTGCPNGCVRPYQCDIGIVGRSGTKYTIFVGGNVVGDRLNFLFQDLVPYEQIVPTLAPLLQDYRKNRNAGEGFGDYCQKMGLEKLLALLPDDLRKPMPKHLQAVPNYQFTEEPPAPQTSPSVPERTADSSAENQPAVFEVVTGTEAAPTVEQQTPTPASEIPVKESEVFMAGCAGEELPDFTYHYNCDRSVRETIVYYYGDNQRAANAPPSDSLLRHEVYCGKVDPARLENACKSYDLYFAGPKGREVRDRRVDYLSDGAPARTTLFMYAGDLRAADVTPDSPVRRQVVYKGLAE